MTAELELKLNDDAREFMRTLYLSHNGDMLRTLRLMRVPEELESEVVFRTLTTAWQKRDVLALVPRPGAWLIETLRHHARNARRHHWRRARHLDLVDEPASDEGDDRRDDAEGNLLLEQLLARLEDDEQGVILCRVIHGCTLEETAELTGSTIDRVRGAYERARAKLSRLLRGR